MYRKYYGIFKFEDNSLIGYGYNCRWFYNLVYPFPSYEKTYEYFNNHQKYPEFKNTFILKISGKYFTPILKRYNKLYKLDWSTFCYYKSLINVDGVGRYYKNNIFYKEQPLIN